MKSKPVYAALELDATARRHLFLTQGPGGQEAARRVLATHPAASFAVLSLDDPTGREAKLDDALADSGMETAFYVAGPEVFLWQTANRLRQAGIENRRIRQQLAGSAARRVYCVHCRAINEQVTATIHCCEVCGLHLTVRDHFSRPLAAYMGVMVDAESPGDVPEPEILYA